MPRMLFSPMLLFDARDISLHAYVFSLSPFSCCCCWYIAPCRAFITLRFTAPLPLALTDTLHAFSSPRCCPPHWFSLCLRFHFSSPMIMLHDIAFTPIWYGCCWRDMLMILRASLLMRFAAMMPLPCRPPCCYAIVRWRRDRCHYAADAAADFAVFLRWCYTHAALFFLSHAIYISALSATICLRFTAFCRAFIFSHIWFFFMAIFRRRFLYLAFDMTLLLFIVTACCFHGYTVMQPILRCCLLSLVFYLRYITLLFDAVTLPLYGILREYLRDSRLERSIFFAWFRFDFPSIWFILMAFLLFWCFDIFAFLRDFRHYIMLLPLVRHICRWFLLSADAAYLFFVIDILIYLPL